MDAAVRWRDGTPGHRKEKPQPKGWGGVSADGGSGYFTEARLGLKRLFPGYAAQAGHQHSECRLSVRKRKFFRGGPDSRI